MDEHPHSGTLDELVQAGMVDDAEAAALRSVWEAWCRDLRRAEPPGCTPRLDSLGGPSDADSEAGSPGIAAARIDAGAWRRSIARLGAVAGLTAAGLVLSWLALPHGTSPTSVQLATDAARPEHVTPRSAVLNNRPVAPNSGVAIGNNPPSLRAVPNGQSILWDDVIDRRLDAALHEAGRLVRPVAAEDRYFQQFERAVRRLAVETEQSSL